MSAVDEKVLTGISNCCVSPLMQACTGAAIADLANLNIIKNLREHYITVFLHGAHHSYHQSLPQQNQSAQDI